VITNEDDGAGAVASLRQVVGLDLGDGDRQRDILTGARISVAIDLHAVLGHATQRCRQLVPDGGITDAANLGDLGPQVLKRVEVTDATLCQRLAVLGTDTVELHEQWCPSLLRSSTVSGGSAWCVRPSPHLCIA
jgi:hypothetical protein